MEKKFKYDAFISYRHADLDKFVAENLHKELEGFRLPKVIAKKRPGQKNRIERVFRDKEELPLTSNLNDPIMAALHDSEYLIVVCSPRLRESMWCKKEIETFVALRGREHVMAVLIEGEPVQSFPDELLFRTEKRQRPDGLTEEIKIPVEPLAADVRGKDKKEIKKLLPAEVQRLCAGMFHLNYDDIRQRHREQKMRRILTASLVGGAICLAFGIYSTATALRIHSQNKKIEAQSAEIQAQAEEILQQNEELAMKQALSLAELAEQYLEEGDRQGAIATAAESLTESDGIALPFTPEGQYILNESLRAYDIGVSQKAEYQIELAGRIADIKQTQDLNTIAVYDDTGAITLFDLQERKIITIISSKVYDYMGSYAFTFLGNDRFAYVNADKKICILDLDTTEVIKEIPVEQASDLVADNAGNYLAVGQWNDTYIIYNGNTYEQIGTTPDFDGGFYVDGPYISQDGIWACAYSVPAENLKDENEYHLYFVDLNTMTAGPEVYLGHRRVKDMAFKDGVVYLALMETDELYTWSNAYAVAVDIQTGNILWENMQEGYWTDEISVPYSAQGTDLLFSTSENVSLINMENGEVTLSANTGSETLAVSVYKDIDAYMLYFVDGTCGFFSKDFGQLMDVSYKFECKTLSNAFVMDSNYGVAVAERNDNMITVYTYQQGPEVKEIEEEVELSTTEEVIMTGEAKEIAESFGLANCDYVLEAYYSPDDKYCFITYWDHSFVICDAEKKEIVNSMEYAYPTELCIGTDSQGYTYLAGYYGVYVLNEDMKPVMWIEHGVDVDLEQQKVYLSWNSNNYEAPLYSVEELLEIAQQYGK